MRVPRGFCRGGFESASNDDKTRNGVLVLPARATARICRTFDPSEAISIISSKVTRSRRRAFSHTRGSVVATPSTSVKMRHSAALTAAARATALVSEPPRPSVATSPVAVAPWNPVITGTTPAARAARTGFGSIFESRALPWLESVLIPAAAPVIARAGIWRARKAAAKSPAETVSPVETTRSYSRAQSPSPPPMARQRSTKRSVSPPTAETTTAI